MEEDLEEQKWKESMIRECEWHNHIIRLVNEGKTPADDTSDFVWDEKAMRSYNELMREKKSVEEDMIRKYGEILFNVEFEEWHYYDFE